MPYESNDEPEMLENDHGLEDDVDTSEPTPVQDEPVQTFPTPESSDEQGVVGRRNEDLLSDN